MTEPMRENERIAKRIIDTSADGDNSPRYNWAEAELIKALDSKDSLIQAKEAEIARLSKSFVDMKSIADCADIKIASLRTLVKELGKGLLKLSEVPGCGCGIGTHCNCSEATKAYNGYVREIAEEALLLIPEELREERKPNV